jgi:hypothetical protein
MTLSCLLPPKSGFKTQTIRYPPEKKPEKTVIPFPIDIAYVSYRYNSTRGNN